jgi:hypothetical protein
MAVTVGALVAMSTCQPPRVPVIVAANDRGTIVIQDTDSYTTGVVIRRADGSRVALVPPEGFRTWVHDVNDAGVMIGTNIRSRPDQPSNAEYVPTVWDASLAMTDLRPWIEQPGWPATSAYVQDINEHGLVVGGVQGSEFDARAQLFTWDSRTRTGGRLPVAVGGTDPHANAVNDAGVIVGWNHAGGARWTPYAGTWRHERLPGFVPEGINNRGDMVGHLGTPDSATGPAVWLAGARRPTPLSITGLELESDPPDYSFLGFTPTITESRMVVARTSFSVFETGTRVVDLRWASPSARPQQWQPTPEITNFHLADITPTGDAYGNVPYVGGAVWRADGRTEAIPTKPPPA